MTDEAKGVTEKWVDAKGATYAYAFDKGGKLARRFGVHGIPDAILISPMGEVLWRGHPGNLDPRVVQRALEGSLTVPLFDWPKSASAARKSFKSGRYAKALEAVRKLEDDERGIAASIEAYIEKRVANMTSAYEDQRYFQTLRLANENIKGLAGLEGAIEAQKLVDIIKGDDDLKRLVKGQEKLHKIRLGMGEAGKKKQVDKLIKSAKKIASSYEGTVVAEQADELAKALGKKRRELKR